MGFLFYVLSSMAVGGLVALQKADRTPSLYFKGGTFELLTSGLLNIENATGYILCACSYY
jgi:hypothetical protein